ncbi:MAG: type II toxin-antitoxin system RelE/ParE family toxin [Planctomycetes bacterium]|nr:type II toxin-antitoxin system RelE/ParE family toxin [Planctomycetota bacterium]
MDEYEIVFARSARKELEDLPRRIAARVLRRIEGLAEDPRPASSRKLVGADRLWRIRVSDYRVLYAVDDATRLVDVVAVRHRRDAYR